MPYFTWLEQGVKPSPIGAFRGARKEFPLALCTELEAHFVNNFNLIEASTTLSVMELSYKIISPHLNEINDLFNLNGPFEFFHDHWNRTMKDANIEFEFTSDDYKAYDRHVVLMLDGEIIGHHSISFHQIDQAFSSDNKFLNAIPEITKKSLESSGKTTVGLLGGFIAKENFITLNGKKFSVPELLCGLSFKYYKESDLGLLLTVSRNSLNVSKLCEKHGGSQLCPDVEIHGETSSIYAFEKDETIVSSNQRHLDVIESLWRSSPEVPMFLESNEEPRMDAIESIKESVALVNSAVENFPWRDKEAYADLLAQIHYYVSHATRVAAYAAYRVPFGEQMIHNHLLGVIKEEAGHEDMALADIKNLDLDIKNFPERTETSAYYQTLYYHIDRSGPDALIGYFTVLEGVAATILYENFPSLQKIYGENQLTFIHEHAVLDQEHYPEGLSKIAGLPEERQQEIAKIGKFSAELFRKVIDAILEDTRSRHKDLAA